MVGLVISKEWWDGIVKEKRKHESSESFGNFDSQKKGGFDNLEKMINKVKQDKWKNFVGRD